VPDQKVKIAHYSKLLSQLNPKDINILRNKNQQEKDSKDRTLDAEQTLLRQLLVFTENLKNKKRSDFNNNNNTKYKISKEEQIRKINKNKEHMKNNELLNTEVDDKKSKILDTLNDKIFNKKEYNILNNILHKSIVSNNTNILTKGNNKEQRNIKSKQKNDLINELLFQSIKSNNENIINKGNNKEIKNIKSNIKYLTSNNNEFKYHNNEINKDKLNNNLRTYEIINYSNKIPTIENNYESVKSSLENKLHNYDNEKNNQHRKPNNQSNDSLHQDDFETDAEFTESGQKDRRMGIFGSKYMFNKKEYETDMNDTSLNDSTSLSYKNSYKNSYKS